MARKNKAPAREEIRPASEYYKLNTKAVEDLVTADESNSPEVSEEELKKYRSHRRLELGDTLKALLLKFCLGSFLSLLLLPCKRPLPGLFIPGVHIYYCKEKKHYQR